MNSEICKFIRTFLKIINYREFKQKNWFRKPGKTKSINIVQGYYKKINLNIRMQLL